MFVPAAVPAAVTPVPGLCIQNWQHIGANAYLLANDRGQETQLCCSAYKDLVLLAEAKLSDSKELLGFCSCDLRVLVRTLLPLLDIFLV